MRSDRIDKSFIESSWKEMKGILDKEMPIQKNRKGIVFCFLGLFFLLSSIATGIYVSNNQSVSEVSKPGFSSIPNKSQEVEPPFVNLEILQEGVNSNNEFANAINVEPEKDITNAIPGLMLKENLTIPEKGTNPGSKGNQNENLESKAVDGVDNQGKINIASRGLLKFVTPPEILKENNSSKTERQLLAFNYLPHDNPNVKLNSKNLDLPARMEMVIPGRTKRNNFEFNLSTRTYDLVKPNAELTIHYNLINDNFGIIPGIGFGYDNYNSLGNDETINERTLIYPNVKSFTNNSVELEPSGLSSSQSFSIENKSSLYFSQNLLLRKRIKRGFYIQTGLSSRLYPGVDGDNNNNNDASVPEVLGPVQDGSGQSREATSGLKRDNNNIYLIAGMSATLANNLLLNVSYLRQLDTSLSLKAYNGASNDYTNVLERINRNEFRLSLGIKF